MVDALGGVEVCSTTPIEDYELGSVLPVAGRQTVDGHTALNYVRARQVTTETNGDYGRIKRQQLFLSSLLRSLISKETFFSLSKLNNVVNMFIGDSYVDNVDTKDLVDLGQSVQGVSAGRITFVTVPTSDMPTSTAMRCPAPTTCAHCSMPSSTTIRSRRSQRRQHTGARNAGVAGEFDRRRDRPACRRSGRRRGGDAVITDPADVTVQVSNSTAEGGLATTAADALQAHGFNVTTPDDYPGPLSETTVFFSPGNEEAAATVASSFANPTLERVTGLGDVVQVVLGSDFNAVAAPSPSGSNVAIHVVRGTSSTPTPVPDDLSVTNAADTACEYRPAVPFGQVAFTFSSPASS